MAKPIDKSKLKCNTPRPIKQGEAGYGVKKRVVKACKDGQEKLIKFGSAEYRHNYSAPANENFRARMQCDTKPPDKLTARYWACESLWARRKKRSS